MKIIYDNGREEYYDNIKELIFRSLVNKKLNFEEVLSVFYLYVEHLEDLEFKLNKQIEEIDMPLVNVIDPMEHWKGKPTIDAIYRYLVKYERFKNAPVWEKLVKYVKNNNINLNGNCFSDLYKDD